MNKITPAFCLLALILFFLPWLNISCNEKVLMTQSGVQIIYGGVSAFGEMKNLETMGGGDSNGKEKREGPGLSLMTGLAFLGVLGATLISLAAFLGSSAVKLHPKIDSFLAKVRGFPVQAGLLTAIALGLLLVNVIFGFPVSGQVRKEMKEVKAQAVASEPEAAPMGLQMPPIKLSVDYRWPLYLELLALAVPAFLMLNDKHRWVALGGAERTSAATIPPAPHIPPPPGG